MKRYGVEKCDEGGTLTTMEGTPVEHTWSVVDRTKLRDDGTAKEVSNHYSRKAAREEAAELNAAESDALICKEGAR